MTVDQKEIAQFTKDAPRWWDVHGPFAPLHRLNPVRLQYIRGQIDAHYDRDPKDLTPYGDLSILDIGCGGGLVCEPMARLGAKVTGIDADAQAIAAAKDHAEKSGLKINYQACTTADLLPPPTLTLPPYKGGGKKPARVSGGGYDVVLALEVIEHVSNPDQFIREVVALTKPGGLIIMSTLNRTAKSYALGIVAAEYVLRWVAPGTHRWKKFVKPHELARLLRANGAEPSNIQGMTYHPLNKNFVLSANDTDVNYFMSSFRA